MVLCNFSGNYTGWKATCIGNNSSSAVSMLKQEYKEGATKLADALDLSIKVLSKTLVCYNVNVHILHILIVSSFVIVICSTTSH